MKRWLFDSFVCLRWAFDYEIKIRSFHCGRMTIFGDVIMYLHATRREKEMLFSVETWSVKLETNEIFSSISDHTQRASGHSTRWKEIKSESPAAEEWRFIFQWIANDHPNPMNKEFHFRKLPISNADMWWTEWEELWVREKASEIERDSERNTMYAWSVHVVWHKYLFFNFFFLFIWIECEQTRCVCVITFGIYIFHLSQPRTARTPHTC